MSKAWEETVRQFKELNPKYRPPQVNTEALAIFTRQFSAMIDAGIPIPRALAFFAEGEVNPNLRKVVESLADKVFGGVRMSHAMRSFPQVFSEVYVSLVETGENSGQISTAMQRLAELMEKQLRMQKRIIATLTYPLILMFVSFLCVGVFIFFILPMIEPMFLSMNIPLPLPTRIMLSMRTILVPSILLGVLAVVGVWVFRPFVREFLEAHPRLRSQLWKYPLTMPIFGGVIRKVSVARVLYSMATMIDSGMTLVQAISRAGGVSGNLYVTERLQLAKAAIVEGETVAHAFAVTEVFPESAVQLMTIGEETSSLSTMVKYIADMYDEDADLALTDMANMLEPLLMGGMGIVVGFIVISAMLPTLQLIQSL